MITTDKLADVADTLEQLTRAQEAVDGLHKDEPGHGTPTLRAVELGKISRDLGEMRRQIAELWS